MSALLIGLERVELVDHDIDTLSPGILGQSLKGTSPITLVEIDVFIAEGHRYSESIK